ncbi:MAG: hypothetical protein O8C62_05630 [Candidatus Methanoperedens sp.]|nr:hypothetical protein [Candidatus Methanoperedens sp.]
MESMNNIQKTNELPSEETMPLKNRRIVTRTTHSLPDKGSSIETHIKIIKAYVIVTNEGKKAVSYKDFKDLVDFYYGSVSSNNKFLKEFGLIAYVSHGMYVPTKYAIDFQRFKTWGQEDKALDILRELVKASWFWQVAKQVLLIREDGADEREILNKLGSESKADPERGHIDSLKILLKYLEYVGLVKLDEKTKKIKMALEFTSQEPPGKELITGETQNINSQISEIKENISVNPQLSLTTQNTPPTEPTHYREEPGHFAIRVKLDETSIQLLDEEIKYIKGKYALLQKSKKAECDVK